MHHSQNIKCNKSLNTWQTTVTFTIYAELLNIVVKCPRLPSEIAAQKVDQEFNNNNTIAALLCNTLVKSTDMTGTYKQCTTLI